MMSLIAKTTYLLNMINLKNTKPVCFKVLIIQNLGQYHHPKVNSETQITRQTLTIDTDRHYQKILFVL